MPTPHPTAPLPPLTTRRSYVYPAHEWRMTGPAGIFAFGRGWRCPPAVHGTCKVPS